MKTVLFTQRVEIVTDYNERRDCADQNIPRFLSFCGFIAMPLPNLPGTAMDFVKHIKPDGIILTGGNDLYKYGGNAPERDETERLLIEYAMHSETPLLGFCRGMQVIGDYFDATLTKVSGHSATQHKLVGRVTEEVNSYHNFAFKQLPSQFLETARSDDGVIEAFRHRDKQIYGIMWHPEREAPFRQTDKDYVARIISQSNLEAV
jgi:putative glutamine amidotransferase